MADRDFLKQPATDGTAAEAAKHVITTDVTVPAGHASNPPGTKGACAGPYYPGNAKAIFVIATAGTIEFWAGGSGESGGAAATVMRELTMSGEQVSATATKVGVINGDTIPREFFLYDTSASTNAATMYWVY